MRLRLFLICLIAFAVMFAPTEPALAQGEINDCARTIIGCADAGPSAEVPGDRGGYAQLLTFSVLLGALAFIAWRVVRSTHVSATEAE